MVERGFCAVFSILCYRNGIQYKIITIMLFLSYFLYFIFKIEIHSSESTCRSWWESTGRWKNCLWSKRFRMLWRMTRSPRHPITTSMSTPEKIKNVFDPILYKNAASVLRVLNTFVTTYLFIISFESICNPWGMFNIKG